MELPSSEGSKGLVVPLLIKSRVGVCYCLVITIVYSDQHTAKHTVCTR